MNHRRIIWNDPKTNVFVLIGKLRSRGVFWAFTELKKLAKYQSYDHLKVDYNFGTFASFPSATHFLHWVWDPTPPYVRKSAQTATRYSLSLVLVPFGRIFSLRAGSEYKSISTVNILTINQ